MKFKVQWRYTSSLGGPWAEGDEVELEKSLAHAINIDSPGVLVLIKEDKPEALAKAEDRQVKSGKTRGAHP